MTTSKTSTQFLVGLPELFSKRKEFQHFAAFEFVFFVGTSLYFVKAQFAYGFGFFITFMIKVKSFTAS